MIKDNQNRYLKNCLLPSGLRQPGNNKLCFYGDELDSFDFACRRLMDKLKTVLPEGCPRARIRTFARGNQKHSDDTLASTLGDESRGMARGSD